ncbi:MAG: hypothetical protein WKF88_09195 [Ferruginibacter sp.]
MKILMLLITTVVSLYSCSKKNDVVTPPSQSDTLTTGWSFSQTIAQGEDFSDIFFTDNNFGYALSKSGVYKSVNGGQTFSKINNTPGLINMAAIGTGKALFVAQNPTPLVTLNGGSSFSNPTLPTPPGGLPSFQDCFYSSSNTCYLSSSRYVWKSLDGGNSFDTVFTFIPGSAAVSLYFLNDNSGWILRNEGLYKTTDGGYSWITLVNQQLNHGVVYFADANNGFYSSNANNIFQINRTTNGGTNWQSVFQSTSSGGEPAGDIHFVSNTTGYFSFGNRVYKTTNGGSTWTPILSLANNQTIIEIHFTDVAHGWALTVGGKLFRFVG